MEIIKFDNKEHKNIVDLWLKERQQFPFPDSILSENGFMIYSDNTPICVGWVYQTDSKIALFENIVANPNVSSEIRDLGIDQLLEYGINFSKERNNLFLFGVTVHPKMTDRITSKFNFIELKDAKTFVRGL